MNNEKILMVAFFTAILSLGLVSAGLLDIFDKITGRATDRPVNLSLSAANRPPQIVYVDSPTVTMTEDSFVDVLFYFTVYEPDKTFTLNFSTDVANFSKPGEVTRENLSCAFVGDIDPSQKYGNFSCTIRMWYFDGPGAWNITVAISDNSWNNATNTTQIATVNQLTAFVQSPDLLTWATFSPNSYNLTSTNDPLLLNNTGNANITALSINATDLVGETDSNYSIYSGNFSVHINQGGSPPAECGGTLMEHYNFKNVTSGLLPKGNHSVNDGNTGQEQLYYCLTYAGNELTQQTYSTLTEGSWTVKIIPG